MPDGNALISFNTQLSNSLGKKTFLSIHYSNSRTKEMTRIHSRIVVIKNKTVISTNILKGAQDFTQNDSISSFVKLHAQWVLIFKQVLLVTKDEQIQLLINKKQEGTIKSSPIKNLPKELQHDRNKNYIIPSSAPFLFQLGISSSKGQVKEKSQKKYRQINKFVEILKSHLPTPQRERLKVYDFGCGKGYLTFATYYYLHMICNIDIEMVGVDLKEKVINEVNTLAKNLKYDKLSFEVGNISSFKVDTVDVMFALHACDIATDIAIAKAINAKAKLIIMAPCCQKQIRKSFHPTSFSKNLLKHGILEERMASLVTDSLRGLLLENEGYRVKIFEFISSEHTSKNIMLLAEYTGIRKENKQEIIDIKNHYGIKHHYLEQLL